MSLHFRGKFESRLAFLLTGIGCFGAVVDFVAKLREPNLKLTASSSFLRKLRFYFVLFAALTGKTHNVPLLAMVCCLQEVYFFVSPAVMTLSSVSVGGFGGSTTVQFVCHWIGAMVMGMFSFFAQVSRI